MFKRMALALMLVISLGAASGAHADDATSGVTLRIYTAPSWCHWCQVQEAKMRELGWTEKIPVVINGQTIQVKVEAIDVDTPAGADRAQREGIHAYPTNQVVVDGTITNKHDGALQSRDQILNFIEAGLTQSHASNASTMDLNRALAVLEPADDPRDVRAATNAFNPSVEAIGSKVNRSPAIASPAGL